MTATNDSQSAAGLSHLLGRPVETLVRLIGGRNSQVFSVTLTDGQKYVAKRYFRHESDPRDRQGVEFQSLRFLWDQGVRCIAEPIDSDQELGWSVFEFAGDTKVTSQEVTEADIDFSTEFLLDLSDLNGVPGSELMPPASEACFSMAAIIDNIDHRLEALSEADAPELVDFLQYEFRPGLALVVSWCQEQSEATGISFTSNLDRQECTLSPSDFGFHNAVHREDGSIVFLDFEYFGWDDPAKMTSDFLLHPAMELQPKLLRRFAGNLVAGFSGNRQLADRIRLTYPLFGLKWCLILLNEFLPANIARREFAAGQHQEALELRAGQLAKAKTMFDRVNHEYMRFPYLD